MIYTHMEYMAYLLARADMYIYAFLKKLQAPAENPSPSPSWMGIGDVPS